jgi:hypothetical protein
MKQIILLTLLLAFTDSSFEFTGKVVRCGKMQDASVAQAEI